MGKYQIESYPQDKYKFKIYINNGKKSWQQIKKETGCYAIINLEYYNMDTFSPDTALMSGGKWLSEPKYLEYGICIDKNGLMKVGTNKEAIFDYAVAVPAMYYNGKINNEKYFNNTEDKNGATSIGFLKDGTPVLFLCARDDINPSNKMSSNEVCKAMISYGCTTILRYDGSWSSQGDLGNGKVVDPAQERIVHNYLLVFKKDSIETQPKKYTICLDPGHFSESTNQSPDGLYKEYEFAWNLAQRQKKLLQDNGFNVVLTRDSITSPNKTLTERAKVSNDAKADLAVSNHTNSSAGNGWSNAVGLEIYTSKKDDKAARNIVANLMVDEFKASGITLRNPTLKHEEFTFLMLTYAPAVLVEYGFHTNKEEVKLLMTPEYRDKLAEASVKAICKYFNVIYKAPGNTPPTNTTPVQKEPSYNADEWALEVVKKAIKKGLFNGDENGNYNMKNPLTRQELCKILDSLKLLN